MAELVIRDLVRKFPGGGGIGPLSLTVHSGEFLTVLGPSGSGKTTLLRILAGLDLPDQGEIMIDGRPLRGPGGGGAVAMVFQGLALYPHMSAFENIAFPLRVRKVPAGAQTEAVERAARAAGLSRHVLERRPQQLSGGERQRVALARALVREPEVILLDEPLSALDAQLRASVRLELRAFHARTRRTMIYVTHDQLSALSLGQRVAVMRQGRIEQLASPREIYERPASTFVATFVGEPPMNLLHCTRSPDGRISLADGAKVDWVLPSEIPERFVLGIRPEDFRPYRDAASEASAGTSLKIRARAETVEYRGGAYRVQFRLGRNLVSAEVRERVEPGEPFELAVARSRLHFFDDTTGRCLLAALKNDCPDAAGGEL